MLWIICSIVALAAFACWIVYEVKNAPTVDANGKIVEREKAKE